MLRSRSRRRRLLSAAVVLALGISFFPRGSSATVEEQRARLPPPAECPDRIEGTWLGLKYEPTYHDWYETTLVIRRSGPRVDGKAPGPIEGESIAHFWNGGPSDEKPPPCGPGGHEVVVKMPAKGKIDAAGNVEFLASTYTIDRVICGSQGRYNPDNFSGKVEPDRQEFQSVNNDGGRSVNDPVVFRRIRCLDAPHRGTTKATPPAFAPAKRAWSCGR